MPRFSVVLITYNQCSYAGPALESLLRSSFHDIEVLCVDDGSTDGTPEVLRRAAAADPRITVELLPHSGKPAVARNAGLARARGEFVCFLDGDDVVDEHRFSLLDEAIRQGGDGVQVLFHDYADFADEAGVRAARPRLQLAPLRDKLLGLASGRHALNGAEGSFAYPMPGDQLAVFLLSEAFIINVGTACVRRSHLLARTSGFPTDRVVGEDNIVWLRSVLAARVVYVDRVLFYWRKYPGSLTGSTSPPKQRELVRSLHEMASLLGPTSPENGRRIRQRVYEESVELGYVLERSGARWQALRAYATVARDFRRLHPLLRAAKSLIRRPR